MLIALSFTIIFVTVYCSIRPRLLVEAPRRRVKSGPSLSIYKVNPFDNKKLRLGLAVVASLLILALIGYFGSKQGMLLAVFVGASGYLYQSKKKAKKLASIDKNLPFLVDLLCVCVSSGLTLEQSLRRVKDEIGHFSRPLSREIHLTLRELDLSGDRSYAYGNLANRNESKKLSDLTAILDQAEALGTPVKAVLQDFAADLRARRMLEIENRINRLPALISLPLVLFILPPVFIIIMGPVIIQYL